MKRIMFTLVLLLILTSCGTYRNLDLGQLRTGMTIAQVEQIAGTPDKVLVTADRPDGYQVVLAYRTYNDDVYALEFWDDYLVGYEYLYSDVQYVPAPAPPMYYPPVGRPVYIIESRPGRPVYAPRPNNKQPNRTSYRSSGRNSSTTTRDTPAGGRTSTTGRTSTNQSSGRTQNTSERTSSATGSSATTTGRTSTNQSSGRTSYSSDQNSSGNVQTGTTGRTSGR